MKLEIDIDEDYYKIIRKRVEENKPYHSSYEYEVIADGKPIEQEPKTGQWIIYNYPGHECVYCSSCKEEYYEDDLYMGGSDFPKYCPNCGCRMVEPQESEDKE